MKLNLACGKNKIPGWVNVDISPDVDPDEVIDLLKFPWGGVLTWNDNSVEEIFCSHFVEHIGDEIIPFFDEAYRVLQPGGLFQIRCPYYTSIRAVQDPTHKRFISEAFFQYFSLQGRRNMAVDHYPIKSDFDVKEMRFHFPVGMEKLSEEDRKYLLEHAWNTAADIEVILQKHDPNEQGVDRQTHPVVQ